MIEINREQLENMRDGLQWELDEMGVEYEEQMGFVRGQLNILNLILTK